MINNLYNLFMCELIMMIEDLHVCIKNIKIQNICRLYVITYLFTAVIISN